MLVLLIYYNFNHPYKFINKYIIMFYKIKGHQNIVCHKPKLTRYYSTEI